MLQILTSSLFFRCSSFSSFFRSPYLSHWVWVSISIMPACLLCVSLSFFFLLFLPTFFSASSLLYVTTLSSVHFSLLFCCFFTLDIVLMFFTFDACAHCMHLHNVKIICRGIRFSFAFRIAFLPLPLYVCLSSSLRRRSGYFCYALPDISN